MTYAAGMRVALCQLPVSPDPAVNLDRVREALAGAAGRGADLAVFPEATQARLGSDLRGLAQPLDRPFGSRLAQARRGPGAARAVRGAELIVLPAAWATGLFKEEHWVTLVRARAIENTVWVAAASQVPDHSAPPTRSPTGVGRSMMVDPMGTVRADLGPFPGLAVSDLD